ncbi:hypothetical protein DTW90_37205 [Neorhizobium sp. P12A]|uniref:hypothetical protein n=1 Tax=Neorhizobium sp. P12A TaxID=2268027 RepID=UPI0011EEA5B7|nr:hypothetical protein [Neorhizobium sp. P12A]KAA0681161.1 hypothetical protein DTW90_37205 [Neorhizobium sp. P12A]
MQGDETGPTIALGLMRLGTLFGVLAVGGYFFWDMFSETAALDRLAATARSYHYTQSCDADGNVISTAPANCVDLNHYVFVYGPVMKAKRRACTGKPAAVLSFEKSKVATTEINLVQKILQFHAQYGENFPC